MRSSYSGNTLAFQARAEGSIPLLRSTLLCLCGGMVYTTDLKSVGESYVSSSLTIGTSLAT